MERFRAAYYILIVTALLIVTAGTAAKDVLSSISRTNLPIVADGSLNEPAWQTVTPITAFKTYYPEEGKDPSEPTELYITYDADYFYLGMKCFDSNIKELRATMTQREQVDNDDLIGFGFDTYNSERDAYIFNVNPYGIINDFIWHLSGFSDTGWDADVKTGGRIFADYWSVEVAIPFKAMRMPDTREQEWGFYAFRNIRRLGEMSVWPPRTHRINNLIAQASLLRGIEDIETGNNFVLIPYGFGEYENEGRDESDFSAGLDVKYGITSNLMADITINPDYSQIEADPDRLELTERYSQWLPEKRPFFTEGTDIFASEHKLFYSRNIVNPEAGAKITGRFGRYTLGFLSAMDDPAGTDDIDYYNIFRTKISLFQESSIGVLMTSLDNPETSTYNRCASIDSVFRFQEIYSIKSQITRTFSRDETHDWESLGYDIKLERFGDHSYTHLFYMNFPDDFDARAGSLWEELGYRTVELHGEYDFRKPTATINEIELFAGGKGRFQDNNVLKEHYFWAGAELSREKLWSKLTVRGNTENIDDVEYIYTAGELELWHSPSRYMEYYASIRLGEAALYEQARTGWNQRFIGEITLKPVKLIVYTLKLSREDFRESFRGDGIQDQTIVWNKLSYYIQRTMSVRAIHQFNSLDDTSDISLLFSYEYSPLSNIYFGVNSNRIDSMHHLGDDIQVFMKINYLLRI